MIRIDREVVSLGETKAAMIAKMPANDSFASLRRLVRRRSSGPEHCELCAVEIGSDHSHLLQTKTSAIVCSCPSCAILFGDVKEAKYRRIPKDVRALADFVLTDAQWESLAIPINLAFFCRIGESSVPAAFYPSPAGATQSLLDLQSWDLIAEQNPSLLTMEPDVECLLVSRFTKTHEYYIAPVDECFKLVGLIRSNWRGFSGGKEAWQVIGEFFVSLRAKSISVKAVANA